MIKTIKTGGTVLIRDDNGNFTGKGVVRYRAKRSRTADVDYYESNGVKATGRFGVYDLQATKKPAPEFIMVNYDPH